MAESGCWLVPTLSAMRDVLQWAEEGSLTPTQCRKILDFGLDIGSLREAREGVRRQARVGDRLHQPRPARRQPGGDPAHAPGGPDSRGGAARRDGRRSRAVRRGRPARPDRAGLRVRRDRPRPRSGRPLVVRRGPASRRASSRRGRLSFRTRGSRTGRGERRERDGHGRGARRATEGVEALRRGPGARRRRPRDRAGRDPRRSSARTGPASRRSARSSRGVHRPDEGELSSTAATSTTGRRATPSRTGSRSSRRSRRSFPHRSVVENVFLGVEQQRGRGRRPPQARAAGTAPSSSSTGIELPPDRLARHAARRRPAEGRDPARDRPRRALRRDGRADLGADDGRGGALFELDPPARATAGRRSCYVSHFLDEVLELAETVTVLRDGRVVRTSPADRRDARVAGRRDAWAHARRRLPRQASRSAPTLPSSSRSRDLSRPPAIDDVSLRDPCGRDRRAGGLDRQRADRGGAGDLRRPTGRPRARSRSAGVRLRVRNPRDAVRQGVAMVPEEPQEPGPADAALDRREHDASAPRRRVARGGVLEPRAEGRRARRSSSTSLDVRAKSVRSRVSTLSGGNQQKVLFAKWLFHKPRVLIADEPTRGVDVGAKRAIYELIRSLAAEGIGVLLISSEHRGGARPRASRARHARRADRRRVRRRRR